MILAPLSDSRVKQVIKDVTKSMDKYDFHIVGKDLVRGQE